MSQTLLYTESPILGIITTSLPIVAYYTTHSYIIVLISLILLIFFLFFYRYTPYEEKHDNNDLISPACGTISDIILQNDHYLISIFLSPFDRHSQIYPINGTVVKRVYDNTGQYNIVVTRDKSRHNEKKMHYIQALNGSFIKVTQIAGFLPRSITSSDVFPEKIKAGQYMGMIKFGSRVELLLSNASKFDMRVKVDQRVNIGTLLGRYNTV